MNSKRKQIIMSEIVYWKQNKLLPEHYCDFLISLYAQGEEESIESIVPQSVIALEKNKLKRTLILLSVFALIASISMFIVSINPLITLGLSATLFLFYLFYAIRSTIKKRQIAPFLYILSAFMLLLLSMKLWSFYFNENSIILIVFLTLNCFSWLIAGKSLKLTYFMISGIAGLLVITGFVVSMM
ncbi:hypothetical protein ACFSFY_00430 [Sporosarcina siberiensis]|uniref:Uncharacterized protein n=1 Tax=Sporosarcina siberiensis TaxID=1365606 RepID=A0ABW4SCA2_9BACL